MSTIQKSKLVMLYIFLMTVWILTPAYQAIATHREFEPSEAPQLVSLTGILHPLGEKGVTGSNTFTIYIQGREWWIFDVKKARDISGMKPGRVLLQELFPSTLRLVGPKDLIDFIENPEVATTSSQYKDISTSPITC